jgi:hypothetical protein
MKLFIYLALSCCMKVCNVAYWLAITGKLNHRDPSSANPSIQRYWIDENRSLKEMHFWKVAWLMADDDFSNDPVHQFHSLSTYACESSKLIKDHMKKKSWLPWVLCSPILLAMIQSFRLMRAFDDQTKKKSSSSIARLLNNLVHLFCAHRIRH